MGRRAEEFSEAQQTTRETVVNRRDMAVIEENRETSTPVEPANCGSLGGEFTTRTREIHANTSARTSDAFSSENSSSNDSLSHSSDSNINVLIYNTRL